MPLEGRLERNILASLSEAESAQKSAQHQEEGKKIAKFREPSTSKGLRPPVFKTGAIAVLPALLLKLVEKSQL